MEIITHQDALESIETGRPGISGLEKSDNFQKILLSKVTGLFKVRASMIFYACPSSYAGAAG